MAIFVTEESLRFCYNFMVICGVYCQVVDDRLCEKFTDFDNLKRCLINYHRRELREGLMREVYMMCAQIKERDPEMYDECREVIG